MDESDDDPGTEQSDLRDSRCGVCALEVLSVRLYLHRQYKCLYTALAHVLIQGQFQNVRRERST